MLVRAEIVIPSSSEPSTSYKSLEGPSLGAAPVKRTDTHILGLTASQGTRQCVTLHRGHLGLGRIDHMGRCVIRALWLLVIRRRVKVVVLGEEPDHIVRGQGFRFQAVVLLRQVLVGLFSAHLGAGRWYGWCESSIVAWWGRTG